MFEGLKKKRVITEKKKNYFKLKNLALILKNLLTLVKLYLLPNIHKRFINLLERLVILSSGTITENVSEFLDHHLQPVMKEGKRFT